MPSIDEVRWFHISSFVVCDAEEGETILTTIRFLVEGEIPHLRYASAILLLPPSAKTTSLCGVAEMSVPSRIVVRALKIAERRCRREIMAEASMNA